MLDQRLEHGEFAGGEHVHFVALLQLAGGQRQLVLAEAHRLVLAGRGARHHRRLAAQHGLDPRQQLARVERLGQVVVGAAFQALDAAGFVTLGGEHDDRHLVVRLAQATAGGQAVLAGQHEVEHQQLEQLAGQQAIHLLDVLHCAHAVALLAEEALQQAAQAGIIIDYQDFFAFRRGSGAHAISPLTVAALWLKAAQARPRPLLADFSHERFPCPSGAVFIMRRFRVGLGVVILSGRFHG